MSLDKDKVNSDDNSVAVNAVSNSKNDSTMTKPNAETAITLKSTSNDWVNSLKIQEPVPMIRKNIVLKAVDFLIAEQVQKMPLERKVNFLRSKGMTDYEIQTSIQRAAKVCHENQILNNQIAGSLPPHVHYNSSAAPGAIQTPLESQSWFSRLFGPIAFTATVVYIGYQLYKKYIEKWLFGAQKSPLENRLDSVELSIQRCIILLEEKNSSPKPSTSYIDQQIEYNQVRAELKSIKSLLLKRFQFPAPPVSSSIPEWQLKNTKPQAEQPNKTNSTDMPNSLNTSENNILNETQKSPVVNFQSNDFIDNENHCLTNNSTPNEMPLPTSSNQILNESREVVNENGSEYVENNKGIN